MSDQKRFRDLGLAAQATATGVLLVAGLLCIGVLGLAAKFVVWAWS